MALVELGAASSATPVPLADSTATLPDQMEMWVSLLSITTPALPRRQARGCRVHPAPPHGEGGAPGVRCGQRWAQSVALYTTRRRLSSSQMGSGCAAARAAGTSPETWRMRCTLSVGACHAPMSAAAARWLRRHRWHRRLGDGWPLHRECASVSGARSPDVPVLPLVAAGQPVSVGHTAPGPWQAFQLAPCNAGPVAGQPMG